MAESVYLLCAALSLVVAALLFRGFARGRSRLLLWSALAFGIFAINNVYLSIDMVALPEVDLGGPLWRNVLSALSGSLLLFGLIWELR